MLAKLKSLCITASLVLFTYGIISSAQAYSDQDIQTLMSTKQCINCDFENYSGFWRGFYNSLDITNVAGSNLHGIKMRMHLKNVNFSNTDLSESKLVIYINNSYCGNMDYDQKFNFSDFSNSNFSEAIFLGYANNTDFSSSNFHKLNVHFNIDDIHSYLPAVGMRLQLLRIENSKFTGANFRVL